jgi:hypothetical protein
MTQRALLLVLGLLVLLPGPLAAQETIVLTAPIVRPNITGYTPVSLHIEIAPQPRIIIVLANTDGIQPAFIYPCDAPCANSTPSSVAALITALNTANLTTRSLWRRIFDRLVLDFPARFVGGATVP